MRFTTMVLGGALTALSCGSDSAGPVERGGECDDEGAVCVAGLVCAPVTDGTARCFSPVFLRGEVTDSMDATAIEGAHVIALDDQGSAITSVAVTGPDGRYEVELPVERDAEGNPVDETFTLQSSAQGYQPFPGGLRVSLPISTADAEDSDDTHVIESTLTDVTLIALADAEDLQRISGVLSSGETDDDLAGVLVVAKGGDTVIYATTDSDGSFTLFNAPDGEYEVRAYADGLQVEPETVVVDGEAASGVALSATGESTSTVSGSIQLVNAGGADGTSVLLVVDDTFDEALVRGEAPRGLRAPGVGEPLIDGSFEISGVPDGRYVLLAAYENDDLVRDPDTNIAGTDIVRVEVAAPDPPVFVPGNVTSFKVTEALATVSPGAEAPEAVTSAPTLTWADDSSEDYYEVRVFDAFGELVWSELDVPSVSGNDTVSVEYEGPLDAGMYYQFRVQSWRQPGNGAAAPISATEDLRGVFFRPAEDGDE